MLSKTLIAPEAPTSPRCFNMGLSWGLSWGPGAAPKPPGRALKSLLEPRGLPDGAGTPPGGHFDPPGGHFGVDFDSQIVDLGVILEAQIVAFGAFPGSNFHPKSVQHRAYKQVKITLQSATNHIRRQPSNLQKWFEPRRGLSTLAQGSRFL